MRLEECNPYIRAAEIQPAVLEGTGPRKAYDYRLFYILENTGQIIMEDQTYDLCPDSLIIIPPAVEYYFRGHMKTLVLNFDITRRFHDRSTPICPPRTHEFDASLLFETETLDEFSQPYFFKADITIRDALLNIVSEFQTHSIYSDATVSAMLKLLFPKLLHHNTTAENRLCEKVMSYIRIHASSINSNQEIADAFGYHPVYLGELFKEKTGKTLHTAILDEKIHLACQFLTRTDISITEIGFLSGFSSRTHFCTVFKEHLGVTPSNYRKT